MEGSWGKQLEMWKEVKMGRKVSRLSFKDNNEGQKGQLNRDSPEQHWKVLAPTPAPQNKDSCAVTSTSPLCWVEFVVTKS